ncbi:alpha/beta hydrolase [uncultured Corynebacterium sp.]|uniref:alpha/beta hydrolase n=1 Tax=uncultured Corynebacterium sp. TaxID=159447 RepID=UPI002591723F|nr:alpha/beta hydrolase [uncultured Corynebacterium sp.]
MHAPTNQWDKTFPQSDSVTHEKVQFTNGYGLTLAADLYAPRTSDSRTPLPAIAVSGPFGAVKEQSSGLYAQTLAERGFLTIAFDPSFTGESSGEPRNTASPDINTEDFMAAVDYLSLRDDVDPERIGIVGICGWGGIALNAAAADPRIKATLSSTMYDMTRIAGNGYFDQQDSPEARNAARREIAQQRLTDAQNGAHARAGGVVDPVPEGAPDFIEGYHAYYKTERGFHPRSLNSTDGWNVVGTQAYANTRFMHYIDEIENAVLIVHGGNAHSRYMGESAYERLAAGVNPANKHLRIIPGATHCDLYDGGDQSYIPFDEIEGFFRENLMR